MDKKTSIVISIIRHIRQQISCLRDIRELLKEPDAIYFSYPFDGKSVTISILAGITELNYAAGTIKTIHTDGTESSVTKMRHSLQTEGKEFLHSIHFSGDQDIFIQFDSGDKIPVSSNEPFKSTNQQFKTIQITCTTTTKILVVCGTPGGVDLDFPDAVLGYFYQPNLSLGSNLIQTLTNTAANKDFLAANTDGITGLLFTDDNKVEKVTLVILGNVVNTYAGTNALDCNIAAHNQLQIDLDNGGFTDLVNSSKPDGQLLDNDWRCPTEGGIFSFAYIFDITSKITNIDGKIGIRLANGRSEQNSLKVTILSAYINVLWRI